MTRNEQLDFLIKELLPQKVIPQTEIDKWSIFRALINTREPKPVSPKFWAVQDELLQCMIAEKGITAIADLQPVRNNLFIWRGDITTLNADAVVNAANSGMLGCFIPCHGCIDNAIHTYSGVQLRLECAAIMEQQGHLEPTGQAKITKAYNLPSKYVLHTIGPIITGTLRAEDKRLLASCYRSCLALAEQHMLDSVAFCCISTGEFRFPNEEAADIAIETVSGYLESSMHRMKVVFNVFTERDERAYRERLG